jgi:hypothetical protein
MSLNTDGTPKDNRMLAIGLAVAAALCLLFAAVSKHWVGRPGGYWISQPVGFGPTGCDNCGAFLLEGGGDMTNGKFMTQLREDIVETGGFAGAMYADESFRSVDKLTSKAFAPMGWVTFGLGIVAGISLLVTAFLAFKKQRKDLPVSPASIALLSTMGAMITGMVFVATKPLGPMGVGVQYGFWIFGTGLVLGIIAAQMLSKLIKPIDEEMVALEAQIQAYGV